jgi:hypothetical protein
MSTETGHDTSRPVATSSDYTLSIEEVSERYARAGHPRTIRTLQRYAASGHLDAQKIATTLGDKYLVTPQSVARHIAQIEELRPLDIVATDRDQPRLVATPVAQELPKQNAEPTAATGNDIQRQNPTPNIDTSRYVVLLERDNEFLRDQVKKKDEQITDLSKRFGETQTLLGAMQRMLAPLLGQADPFHAPENREVPDPPTA